MTGSLGRSGRDWVGAPDGPTYLLARPRLRGLKTKGKAQQVFPVFKDDGKWRQDIDSRFPHSVDLVPPEDGFPDAVEQQIVHFLVPLFGRYELYADVQGDEPVIRYCFVQAEDVAAFQTAFASAALKYRYKNAG
jgi:hypothetical protein